MNWANNKTIVVPVDFSAVSFRALDEALEMVASPSQVHVIHVLHDSIPNLSDIPVGPSKREVRVLQAAKVLRDQLSDRKYKEVHVHVCEGDPGAEIAKFAQCVNANLIVMSSHGQGGFTRLVIGSVAERVVRLADCPVLILKTVKRCASERAQSHAESFYAGALNENGTVL